MKFWFLLLTFAQSCLFNQIDAQISGVINQYTPVTNISCNEVEVWDASVFSVGDRVLIIQMKGADINTSNTAAFGTVTNYNSSGHYEFATISSISGNLVSFQYRLLNSYEVTGLVQLILVPQYSNTTVTGTLTAPDWNGSTGGVLVMEVSGTLTLNAPISLTGKGFRGSFACTNPDGGCGSFQNYFYPVSSGYGAGKGEGIAHTNVLMDGGRGALANGGGGGNKHNSGGGGGSNGSKGGRGGDQANFCGQQPLGGEGGFALGYGLPRIFMGGGGGSSDHNNGVGTSGSDGGGIIIIRAGMIQSNNSYIESNGENVAVVPNNIGDGSGGGGAGGTLVFDVNSFSGALQLRVNGGNGGDQQTTYPGCFGPGGGGGTGLIQISGSLIPANVTTQFIPGNAGVTLNSSSSCYMQTYGAAPGQFGPVYSFNQTLPESTFLPATIDIGPDIEDCSPIVVVNPNINATGYLWSTGATTPTLTVTASGEYWLSVTYGNLICSMRDTILVTLDSITVDAGPDQDICVGENVILHASSATNATFSWDHGVVDSVSFSPQTTTVYIVTATSSNMTCSNTDSVQVTVNPLPIVSVTSSVPSGCVPLTVMFDNLSTDCANCTWTFSNGTMLNGCGDQFAVFENPGCYDLTMNVTSNAGCVNSANFPSIVCVSPVPVASFYPSPISLNEENTTTTMVNNSIGATHYEWNFGDGQGSSDLFEPLHSYSPDGFESYLISLTVTDDNGCSDIAYGKVYMEAGVIYYVPNSFTPDGNEFNQVFRPVFTSGFDLTDFNFQVFNRWGEVVFESQNAEVGWDGTYHDEPAQEGVYTWRIEFKSSRNSDRQLIHGHLNLLK
ncbi:PKD domain-containing protein [Fluviicola taffensis]|uniref:PKD domain-containing protein n=1 Tax=Fluviicola taffensis TaxID=191579 RepID=UPI003137EEA1